MCHVFIRKVGSGKRKTSMAIQKMLNSNFEEHTGKQKVKDKKKVFQKKQREEAE